MGKDNTPSVRQAAQLQRKKANRITHDRVLIVSEGSKTEPLYFGEIRQHFRLQTATVQVRPSEFGTQPLQVVEYAEQLFLKGDASKGIAPVLSSRCMRCLTVTIMRPTKLHFPKLPP
jgi:hypothetical protein